MPKILVLYYSRSGNTEKMAKAVAQGAEISGKVTVDLLFHVEAEELSQFDAVIVGAPTYHHEMPVDFKKLLEEAESKQVNLKGKVAAAFGSYGWSGEAPGDLLEILKTKFEMETIQPPLLMKYAPDEKMIADCIELGKAVAEKLMNVS